MYILFFMNLYFHNFFVIYLLERFSPLQYSAKCLLKKEINLKSLLQSIQNVYQFKLEMSFSALYSKSRTDS